MNCVISSHSHAPAWECTPGRSSGQWHYATLERRDLLPRWSVGARRIIIPATPTSTPLVTPLQRCHACARRCAPGGQAAEMMIKARQGIAQKELQQLLKGLWYA